MHTSTSLFNSILKYLPDAMFVIDTHGRVIVWNDEMVRLTGVESKNIIGKGSYEYSLPLYGTRRPILIDMIINSGKNISLAYDKLMENGSIMRAEGYAPEAYSGKGAYLSGTASPLFDEDGNWIGAIETIRDITELNKIENELIESENHYRMLVESIQFGIALIDKDYNLIWTNPAQSRIFRKPDNAPKAEKCYQEHEKRDTICSHCPGKIAMENGSVHSVETTGVCDDGSKFDARLTAFPQYSSEGEITGFIEIVEDISERKNAENLLRESLEEKETLLKEVHHRVKNNLQVIVSLLNIQSDEHNDPELRDQFLLAINRIKSMSYIHENLYRTGNFSRIDFAEYITRISYHILESNQYNNKTPAIHYDIAPLYLEITQAVPCGLIVNEILTNTFKYAFPQDWTGNPEIGIELHIDDGNMVELVIRDNGIGVDKQTTSTKKSTMGLTLVGVLTTQLKGDYSFDVEEGTRFLLRFKKS